MNTPSDPIRPGNSSRPSGSPHDGGRRPRFRTAKLALTLLGVATLSAACTSGPGDRADFIEVLRLDDGFTENEATCIADAVFQQYGEDDDALGKISGAESYEWLIGEEGVEGFDQFFPEVVADCTTVGPSPGG